MFNFVTALVVAASIALPSAVAPETGSVIDGGDLFTFSQIEELDAQILDLAENTDVFYAVETVASLNGADLETTANSRANELGVGDAEKNNGVFLFISRDDRVMRVEVGSGLEEEITDAEAANVIDNTITPYFKNGDYFGGVSAGLSALEDASYQEAMTAAESEDFIATGKIIDNVSLWVLIIFGLIGGLAGLYAIVRFFVRRARDRREQERETVARLERERLQKQQDAVVYEVMGTSGVRAMSPFDRESVINRVVEASGVDYETQVAFKTAIQREIISELQGLYKSVPLRYAKVDFVKVLANKTINETARIVEKDVEKARAAHQKVQAEERAAQERAREAKRKQKQDADSLWKRLSEDEKRKLGRLSGSSQKRYADELGRNYGYSDVNYFLPLLLTTYIVSSSYAPSSRSSSYDSGSSYSSSSFSSFGGGGSFDGGGASGSW